MATDKIMPTQATLADLLERYPDGMPTNKRCRMCRMPIYELHPRVWTHLAVWVTGNGFERWFFAGATTPDCIGAQP